MWEVPLPSFRGSKSGKVTTEDKEGGRCHINSCLWQQGWQGGWEVPLPSFRGSKSGKVGGCWHCPASVVARCLGGATVQLPWQQEWQGGWEVPLPSFHGSKSCKVTIEDKEGGRGHCPASVMARVVW